ncbi:MAG: response regulator [Chloroflexi bacterium]|nr:response regulator [Chloroflexota bacterium]
MAKILVVDDEMELVQLCRIVLEDAGYKVAGAYNGSQALRVVGEDIPQLILLDVMMPGMTGIEVCRQLRKGGLGPDECSIVMYTADDSRETRTNSMEAGANDLISKQVPIFELAGKIREYLPTNGSQH